MEKINFREIKDLGGVLQDASKFIRQNFMQMMKPAFAVAIIPAVLGGILLAGGMKSMFMLSVESPGDPTAVFANMAGMVPGYILLFVAHLASYTIFIAYVKAYVSGVENITFSDLMSVLKSKGVLLFFGSIVLLIAIYVGLILCVIPGVYLAIVLAHFYPVVIIEEVGFATGWKRCFHLIRDNWWPTFGLYFVTYLISMGLFVVFYIPTYLTMMFQMVESSQEGDPTAAFETMGTMMSMLMPFYFLLSLVMSVLYAVVSSMKYYSLVESRDGSAEKELIDSI